MEGGLCNFCQRSSFELAGLLHRVVLMYTACNVSIITGSANEYRRIVEETRKTSVGMFFFFGDGLSRISP